MSTNGNPPQNAPSTSYLQLMLTRPAINPDGTLALWFAQFLQRLTGTVGSGGAGSGSGGSGGGSSLTDIVNNLINNEAISVGAGGTDAATLSRIRALEISAELDGPKAQPITAALSNAMDQVFGSDWGDIIFRGQYGWEVLEPGYVPNLVLYTGGPNANPYWGIRTAQSNGALGSSLTFAASATVTLLSTGVGTTNALSAGY